MADGEPRVDCTIPAERAHGMSIKTLDGLPAADLAIFSQAFQLASVVRLGHLDRLPPRQPAELFRLGAPEEHPAIHAAVESYRRAPSPHLRGSPGLLPAEPRVRRWIFSTDGVGFPVPLADATVPGVNATTGWFGVW